MKRGHPLGISLPFGVELLPGSVQVNRTKVLVVVNRGYVEPKSYKPHGPHHSKRNPLQRDAPPFLPFYVSFLGTIHTLPRP